jgi:chemotaxis protein methyltransferase CheR
MIANPVKAPIARTEVYNASPALIQIRDLIYKTAGIFHANSRLRLLEERCQKRVHALGVRTMREYYDCLTNRAMSRGELTSLLNEITIGETCFFRNQPQLDGIRSVVIPRIMEAKSRMCMRHLRIWSAGCSTGEEPYTLAIILLEESKSRLKGWTFEVLATDLNQRSLAVAEAGAYGDYSVRNTDVQLREKYFRFEGSQLQINPEVRAKVRFNRVNLSDDAAMMALHDVDIILCCNVLIYFDVASKQRVIRHFHSSLHNHGYLVLGHAESLFGISDQFQLVHLPSSTAYVRSEAQTVEREVLGHGI